MSQEPSEPARSPGEDAAWRSREGIPTPHHRLKWHDHVECSDDWQKEVQKLNPIGRRGDSRSDNPVRSDLWELPSAGPNWDPPII